MSRPKVTSARLSIRRGRGAFIIGGLLVLAACGRSQNPGNGEQQLAAADDAQPVADTLVVYKTASCGCCKAWIEHMERNGFTVVAHDEDVVELNRRKGDVGIGSDLASCHTALVGGYVVEGHVPADLVKRLLRERPQVAGLAAPGMPVGAPGMEGGPKQAYDVIAFRRDGGREVYASR